MVETKREMMKKPVIGITPSFFPVGSIETTYSSGTYKNSVEHTVLQSSYSQWIENGGGIPVIFPFMSDTSNTYQLIQKLDGVLLSGGDDLTPSFYDESPLNENCKGNLNRTWIETAIIREAIRQKKPIFGICRGQQQCNVVFGGTLYQDIPAQLTTSVSHASMGVLYVHDVIPQDKHSINEVFGHKQFSTNSSHHQSVKKVGSNGKIIALADDGIIESIYWEEYRTLTVQWHPERLYNDEVALRLSQKFIDLCAGRTSKW